MSSHRSGGTAYRPACMQQLGLLPPYSIEDVKRAYRHLAKSAHPDAGGDAEAFANLRDAYDRALNLAGFHESRREWLAERVDRYVERLQFVEELKSFGGRCLLQRPDIYLADYGPDFAQILSAVVAVYLTGCDRVDLALLRLVPNPIFQESSLLDLSDSDVTDDGLQVLAERELVGLDLRKTRISARALETLARLPKLEWLHIGQTRIGLWSRMRMRQTFPDVEVVTDIEADQPDYDSLDYRQSKLMQRLAEAQEAN